MRVFGEVLTNAIARKHSENKLITAIDEIASLKEMLEAEKTYLQEEIRLEHNFDNIIGQSDALKYVLYQVEQVASTDVPVLILGETGTGKELSVINVTKKTIKVRMATVDEYVLPPDVTQAYKDAPLTAQKHPSEEILSGKWKGYTPPPMPKKK